MANDHLNVRMQFLQGKDMKQFVENSIKNEHYLTGQEIEKLVKQTVKGLLILHENDISHRDIKPSNI